jgi:hypothetical protein
MLGVQFENIWEYGVLRYRTERFKVWKCSAYVKKLPICSCFSLPLHEFWSEFGKRISINWFRPEGFVERRQQVRTDVQGVEKGVQGGKGVQGAGKGLQEVQGDRICGIEFIRYNIYCRIVQNIKMLSLICLNWHDTLTFQNVFAINTSSDLTAHCYVTQRHTSTNDVIVFIITSLLYPTITTRFGLIVKPLSGLLKNYKDTVSIPLDIPKHGIPCVFKVLTSKCKLMRYSYR